MRTPAPPDGLFLHIGRSGLLAHWNPPKHMATHPVRGSPEGSRAGSRQSAPLKTCPRRSCPILPPSLGLASTTGDYATGANRRAIPAAPLRRTSLVDPLQQRPLVRPKEPAPAAEPLFGEDLAPAGPAQDEHQRAGPLEAAVPRPQVPPLILHVLGGDLGDPPGQVSQHRGVSAHVSLVRVWPLTKRGLAGWNAPACPESRARAASAPSFVRVP